MRATSSIEHEREDHDAQQEMHTRELRWSPRIVYIRAAVTYLASPLVPFAVFKDNPLLNFHAARESQRLYARPENAAEVVETLWNQPFAALTDAQRYFLIAWSAAPRVSPRVPPLAELAFGIATPGPYFKRWIATRAMSFQGEPVAWCIEVNMLGEQEEIIEILLTEENMQRLLPGQAERNNRVA